MIDIYTVLSKNSNLQFCILIMKSVNKSPSKYVSLYESHEHGSIAFAHDYNGERHQSPIRKIGSPHQRKQQPDGGSCVTISSDPHQAN